MEEEQDLPDKIKIDLKVDLKWLDTRMTWGGEG